MGVVLHASPIVELKFEQPQIVECHSTIYGTAILEQGAALWGKISYIVDPEEIRHTVQILELVKESLMVALYDTEVDLCLIPVQNSRARF